MLPLVKFSVCSNLRDCGFVLQSDNYEEWYKDFTNIISTKSLKYDVALNDRVTLSLVANLTEDAEKYPYILTIDAFLFENNDGFLDIMSEKDFKKGKYDIKTELGTFIDIINSYFLDIVVPLHNNVSYKNFHYFFKTDIHDKVEYLPIQFSKDNIKTIKKEK